jgi:hypothetical protein
MKLRTLVLTIAVLAALSAVAFFATRPVPPPVADARVGQSLVDPALVEKAAKLRLSDQGKSVTLTRQADGSWRVTSYYDLPADFAKLSRAIASLTEAKLERLVTSNAERISRLEFKDARIDLLDASDKELWTVTLGRTPDTGGGRYVRFGSEQKAFLATLNEFVDVESKNWANTELLTLKVDDIAKVTLPFAEGGPVTVSRAKKDDEWTADKTPAGQKVKSDKLAAVLGSLSSIRFSDTNDLTDASFAAAKASERVFTVETFDQKTYKIALGRKPEEKKLKPVAADGKAGPGSLGSVADLAKKDEPKSADGKPADPAKPITPEFETIPAGPVFTEISSSDSAAPINTIMQKRAYQVADYTFTSLPQKAEELFEPAPVAAPVKPDEKKVP